MRLKNLTNIEVGRHLVWDGQEYQLRLTAAETKTGKTYHAAVPHVLNPHVDSWLHTYRPMLQMVASRPGRVGSIGGRLWINRSGRPMGSAAIRHQIEIRTKQAFGNAIWPHLFRDCAVTELVDCAPDEIGIAPDLLGHADLQTTKKHYIHAVGMKAHAHVQEVIAARRRVATSRDNTGTSRA